MRFPFAVILTILFAIYIDMITAAEIVRKSERAHVPISNDGNIAVDEVVVESSLHIKTKSNPQYGRTIQYPL